MTIVRRKRFIAIGALAVALVACAAIALHLSNQRTSEPVWHGRTASHWLQDFAARRNLSEAALAFREMGTNADPALVSALKAKDNPFARVYRNLDVRLPLNLPTAFASTL
jgi:hypothetical protein